MISRKKSGKRDQKKEDGKRNRNKYAKMKKEK